MLGQHLEVGPLGNINPDDGETEARGKHLIYIINRDRGFEEERDLCCIRHRCPPLRWGDVLSIVVTLLLALTDQVQPCDEFIGLFLPQHRDIVPCTTLVAVNIEPSGPHLLHVEIAFCCLVPATHGIARSKRLVDPFHKRR